MQRPKIAIVGSGVTGLGAAWALRESADVVVYEADDRLGGHANTVEIDYDGAQIAVDTGFIVYNTLTYPNLTPFLDALGVESIDTDMSFGFQIPGGIEWSSNTAGLFAQPQNLLSPKHWAMLRDILRFNAAAKVDLAAGRLAELSLEEYLEQGKYSTVFRERYLLPMGAAIWSASEGAMREHPAEAFVRFFDNHRLMHLERPVWRTVKGGSRSYVSRVAAALGGRFRTGAPVRSLARDDAGVTLAFADGQSRSYDHAILTCHSDQALALLADPSSDERDLLGAIRYADNTAVLHRDPRLLPRARGAWAAWNYRVAEGGGGAAAVTYDMNRLQHIPADKPLFVTLNPVIEPDPARTFARFAYAHPQFTTPALAAQRILGRIQGVRRTWFAGAWTGYGFHEDGLRAGLRVALRLGGQIPWSFVEGDMTGGPWAADAPASAAATTDRIAAE